MVVDIPILEALRLAEIWPSLLGEIVGKIHKSGEGLPSVTGERPEQGACRCYVDGQPKLAREIDRQ